MWLYNEKKGVLQKMSRKAPTVQKVLQRLQDGLPIDASVETVQNIYNESGETYRQQIDARMVQKAVEYISGLSIKSTCLKKGHHRQSFEFIKCGFEKWSRLKDNQWFAVQIPPDKKSFLEFKEKTPHVSMHKSAEERTPSEPPSEPPNEPTLASVRLLDSPTATLNILTDSTFGRVELAVNGNDTLSTLKQKISDKTGINANDITI